MYPLDGKWWRTTGRDPSPEYRTVWRSQYWWRNPAPTITPFQLINSSILLVFKVFLDRTGISRQHPVPQGVFQVPPSVRQLYNLSQGEFDLLTHWQNYTGCSCPLCFIVFTIHGTKKLRKKQHSQKLPPTPRWYIHSFI